MNKVAGCKIMKKTYSTIIIVVATICTLQCTKTDGVADNDFVQSLSGYVISSQDDSITIAWDPPQNDSVDFYQIFYRVSNGMWSKIPAKAHVLPAKNPSATINRTDLLAPGPLFQIGIVTVFTDGRKSLLHSSSDSTAYPPMWAVNWPQ